MNISSNEYATHVCQDKIGIITMHHPSDLNSLGASMVDCLMQNLDALESTDTRCIILRAATGCKVWSSGHNINEIPLNGTDPLSQDTPYFRLIDRVRKSPIPFIGMLEGSVWGGACDLAACLDILVGCPEVSFAITPARMGLPYSIEGLGHFSGVLPVHIIKEMLFTARPLNAEHAFRLGFLNHLVAASRLEETSLAIATDICHNAPLAVKALKAGLNQLSSPVPAPAHDRHHLENLRRLAYRSDDIREGVASFLEKRAPDYKGL